MCQPYLGGKVILNSLNTMLLYEKAPVKYFEGRFTVISPIHWRIIAHKLWEFYLLQLVKLESLLLILLTFFGRDLTISQVEGTYIRVSKSLFFFFPNLTLFRWSWFCTISWFWTSQNSIPLLWNTFCWFGPYSLFLYCHKNWKLLWGSRVLSSKLQIGAKADRYCVYL